MFGTKINTDKSKIDELLSRGVDEVINREHLKERLLSGERLRVKLGIDPTSPNIHIGRAIPLWKLRQFQDLGHRAVFIVGDFTGIVGDASDKESERPMLTEDQVTANMRTYSQQAFKILDSKKTEIYYNSKWLKKLGFMELAKMANLFGLHEFESREVIAKRIKAGKRVSYHELLYPLMQGYDSVAVRADVELGGIDQRFNLLTGRTLQKFYGQEPQDIMTLRYLPGPDGRKMSSSWGNVINITDEPDNMFGKVMSIPDDLIIKYFDMATQMPDSEIKEFENKLKNGVNPKDIKLRLATEIVKTYYGEETAKKAASEFENIFSRGELPEEIETREGNMPLDLFIKDWLNVSHSEVKRLIDQGAVSINDEVVKEWGYKVKKGEIVKVGPRKFVKAG